MAMHSRLAPALLLSVGLVVALPAPGLAQSTMPAPFSVLERTGLLLGSATTALMLDAGLVVPEDLPAGHPLRRNPPELRESRDAQNPRAVPAGQSSTSGRSRGDKKDRALE